MISGALSSYRGQPESEVSAPLSMADKLAKVEVLLDKHSHDFALRSTESRRGFTLSIRCFGLKRFPLSLEVEQYAQLAHLSKISLAIAPAHRAMLVFNFSDPDMSPKRFVLDNYDSEKFMRGRFYFDQSSRLVGFVEKDVNIRKNARMNPWFFTCRPVHILDKDDNDVYLSGKADVGFQRRQPPEDLIWP